MSTIQRIRLINRLFFIMLKNGPWGFKDEFRVEDARHLVPLKERIREIRKREYSDIFHSAFFIHRAELRLDSVSAVSNVTRNNLRGNRTMRINQLSPERGRLVENFHLHFRSIFHTRDHSSRSNCELHSALDTCAQIYAFS